MLARLDLTGQASEDERTTSSRRAQNNGQQLRHREPSGAQQTRKQKQHNSSSADDEQSNSDPDKGGILSTYLPNPIDLWQSRTPTSLLLLPFVFFVYIILKLPLHYNSKTETKEWKGRAKDVDKLSNELNDVKSELDTVKDDQKEIKGMVTSLRRRLGKMKERRNRREEYLRIKERERIEKERLEKEQHQQQQGVAKDAPITTVTMVKALAVATFVGQPNAVDDPLGKKDN